ncbi:Hypothetical predicted protein [Xyrichtys novacula]|uniref:Secreted protein n=1 Tax=Xyrichtys novacula TaxID=13765 RepID=A0AAV1FYY8_XYRNO|nr:Hypothetical predicted protein [Xyrichtys novacula]
MADQKRLRGDVCVCVWFSLLLCVTPPPCCPAADHSGAGWNLSGVGGGGGGLSFLQAGGGCLGQGFQLGNQNALSPKMELSDIAQDKPALLSHSFSLSCFFGIHFLSFKHVDFDFYRFCPCRHYGYYCSSSCHYCFL